MIRKLIFYNLRFLILGPLLAVQDVRAWENWPQEIWPICTDENSRMQLDSIKTGDEISIQYQCESFRAANYFVEALRANNEIKIQKAQNVCKKNPDIGSVQQIGEKISVAVIVDAKSFYISAVKIVDDLYEKSLFGVSAGCGKELASHKKERLEYEEIARLRSQDLVPEILSAIVTRITSRWRRPPGEFKGEKTTLRISLNRRGELVDVTISSESGNAIFDRSALNAVRRSAPFEEVQQLDKTTFDVEFRNLTIVFAPER